uniref:Ankyrin repeat and SOCS box containing 2a, tandem duplicate 2 n=1 Tax=Myripristis murdjan TaxID=586833 RepID=A0A667XGK0_9TELE
DAEALMQLVRKRSSSLTEPSDEGWIALHEAAYYGQLQCLRILIRAQPDQVNRCDLRGQSALLLAAARQNTSCVECLLERGADPNIADKEGDTPLFKACDRSDERGVELLLRFGASVNRSCSQRATALHEAARHGQVKVCGMLLQAGADLSATNIYGIRPLFTAAQTGGVDILNFLIRKGADVNGQAADGATPLYEASKNGHVSAVETLLSHKADANRASKAGLLPLHIAAQKGRTRIVSALLPVTSQVRVRRSGVSPLHLAAERNRDDILELLIEASYDVNAQLSEERSKMYEDRRSTALYFSVYNRNLEATEMLLEAGADANLDFFNPLLVAVRRGSMEMVTLLLRFGADVNAQISTRPSSFPSALLLSLDQLPMMKLLLDHGCDAASCFRCVYGNRPHGDTAPPHRGDGPPQRCAISGPSASRRAGPVISVLLDYVGHVRLCCRLLEHLDSYSAWSETNKKQKLHQEQHERQNKELE